MLLQRRHAGDGLSRGLPHRRPIAALEEQLHTRFAAQPAERRWSWWGRVIFYDSDVDALHARAIAAGYRPDTEPRDAQWGERFFHITDPDGHELSFAWPLR